MSSSHSSPSARNRDIIVIGSSSGGLKTMEKIFSQIPEDFPGAILAVQHLVPDAQSHLPEILNRISPLSFAPFQAGDPVVAGRGYIAPPNQHLLIDCQERVVLTNGPRENCSRPSIDPLFRSAAVCFGPRVVGVVLTGNLDDGSAGLVSVNACGGVTVVQDPDDAEFPEMPTHAMNATDVDHCVSSEKMPELLRRLTNEAPGPRKEPPPDLVLEAKMALTEERSAQKMDQIGTSDSFSCPECGGPLWKIGHGNNVRYRCHTGHAYTSRALAADASKATERSLWAALRAMEERGRLLTRLGNSMPSQAKRFHERAGEAEHHASVIRKLLVDHEI